MGKFLKRKRVQRAIYVICFISILFISILNGSELNLKSSLGISYWYFFIVPSLVLLYQIIFNNLFGWGLSILLYFLYLLWAIIRFIKEIKDNFGHQDYLDYFVMTIFLSVLILIGYVFYLMKPAKK